MFVPLFFSSDNFHPPASYFTGRVKATRASSETNLYSNMYNAFRTSTHGVTQGRKTGM